MVNTFCKNLKRFRLSKSLTQEQAADALGVSSQTVSRWECGTSLPDATILPHIARLYCVTIDDLYKENSMAYENYASRLGSIYESTRNANDFIRADAEYKKLLKSGEYTTEDLRSYGVIYQYRMEDCREEAQKLYDRVLEKGPSVNSKIYWLTKRQKLHLYSRTGRAEHAIEEQRAELEADPENVENWICLIAAYQNAGQHKESEQLLSQAMMKFPKHAMLCQRWGNVCYILGKYDEAILHWERTIEMDPTYSDAYYAIAYCYQDLGEYEKAYAVWNRLADELESRGFDIEAKHPRNMGIECLKKLKEK